jgi:Protein of unknown function (DUF3102)
VRIAELKNGDARNYRCFTCHLTGMHSIIGKRPMAEDPHYAIYRERFAEDARFTRNFKERTLTEAIEVGKRLIEIRKVIKQKGYWVRWLREEVEFSPRTAYNLMNLARFAQDPEEDGAEVLKANLPLAELYAMAADTPHGKALRKEASDRVTISSTAADSVLKKGRRPPPPQLTAEETAWFIRAAEYLYEMRAKPVEDRAQLCVKYLIIPLIGYYGEAGNELGRWWRHLSDPERWDIS